MRALELLSLVSRVSSKAGHSEAIERRSVTSRHHGSKFLDLDQQSFLTEAAICIEERWKKLWATVFLSANIPYSQDHG